VGVPVHDDRLIFEFLVLEGAQAGLSWLTILRSARPTAAPSRLRPYKVARSTPGRKRRCSAMRGSCATVMKIESAVGTPACS